MKKFVSISLLIIIALTVNACSPKSNDGEYKEVRTGVETDYVPYNLGDLADASELIVMARLKEESETFLVQSYGGNDLRVFRDLTFDVEKIYKGSLQDKNSVTVRLAGGKYTDEEAKIHYIFEANEPEFDFDKDYLVFLTRPKVDPYKTRDDYYSLVTGPQAAFKVFESQIVNVEDPSKTYELTELDTIDKSVDPDTVTKNEVDKRLKDGEMTQEDYDQYFESLDQYGEKIK